MPGYYKVTFTVLAYSQASNTTFDETKDFISLGFRQVGTDNVFIGASAWDYDEQETQIVGQGIIAVTDVVTPYELVNLGPQTIYLNTPDLNYISSSSYFTNPMLTIVIEYLGRQGA